MICSYSFYAIFVTQFLYCSKDDYFVKPPLTTRNVSEEIDLTRLVIDTGHFRIGVYHEDGIRAEVGKAIKLYEDGKYEAALHIFEEMYSILNQSDPEYDYTFSVGNYVGIILYELQRYDEAVKVLSEVLKVQERLGVDISGVLSNLGTVLNKKGDHDKAYEISKKMYTFWKNKFGPDHINTLIAWTNIAYVLQNRKKYDEALEILEEVYEIKGNKFGVNDPSTLITQDNMARLLMEMGDYEEALENFEEVFEKRKRALGLDHPDTLFAWEALAEIHEKVQKFDKALQIYDKLYMKYVSLFGFDSVKAVDVLENMADILENQQKFQEAYETYKKLYELLKRTDRKSRLLRVYNRMGILLYNQGKNNEALKIFEEVYNKNFDMNGARHPSTMTAQYNIATVLQEQGNLNKALKIFEDVYDKRAQVLGADNSYTIDALNNRNSLREQLGML